MGVEAKLWMKVGGGPQWGMRGQGCAGCTEALGAGHRDGHVWDSFSFSPQAWAVFKGKFKEGDKAEPATWKTRLRCALNKSPDFEEVTDRSQLDISEPYKVYRIVPEEEQKCMFLAWITSLWCGPPTPGGCQGRCRCLLGQGHMVLSPVPRAVRSPGRLRAGWGGGCLELRPKSSGCTDADPSVVAAEELGRLGGICWLGVLLEHLQRAVGNSGMWYS